ncbi:hypothetical protein PMAC_002790, partial [Pneumocystis sp. 'macacae']
MSVCTSVYGANKMMCTKQLVGEAEMEGVRCADKGRWRNEVSRRGSTGGSEVSVCAKQQGMRCAPSSKVGCEKNVYRGNKMVCTKQLGGGGRRGGKGWGVAEGLQEVASERVHQATMRCAVEIGWEEGVHQAASRR